MVDVQDRGYVVKQGKALQATSRGRVLSAFLQHYFTQYVDYDFTSHMEAQLDEVAGEMQLGTVLNLSVISICIGRICNYCL